MINKKVGIFRCFLTNSTISLSHFVKPIRGTSYDPGMKFVIESFQQTSTPSLINANWILDMWGGPNMANTHDVQWQNFPYTQRPAQVKTIEYHR